MRFKNYLITIAAIAIFAIPAAALADYTDYIEGVGVIKVQWAGKDADGNPTFNILNSKDNTIASGVKGYIDRTNNNRGVPDLSTIKPENQTATTQKIQDIGILPPANIQTSVLDSSVRRVTQFTTEHPEVTANQLLIGYPSNTGPILAPDNNTTAREVATIVYRETGVARGNKAWDLAASNDNSKPLTVADANELIKAYNSNLTIVDQNGDGIIQRGELFNSVPQQPLNVPSSSPRGLPPSLPVTPSGPVSSGPPLVPVVNPPFCSFKPVRSNTILVGTSATLKWSCVDASSCSVSPGIGDVGTSGEKLITPSTTTTYTLTCRNSEKTSSYDVIINVFEAAIREIIPSGQ